MMEFDPQSDPIPLPRSAVRFPVELVPPSGFRVERPSTWPRVEGRLEFVGGRLLYMPPCGTEQAAVASDLNFVLVLWGRQHPEFIVGGNAAGLLIDEEARGAEAMVWRRDSMGAHRRGFLRVPPILVAEVAGEDDTERSLLEKARWYLDRSVGVVWLLLPRTREVVVITPRRSLRRRAGQRLPRHRSLPGLEPSVDDLFRQLP